MNKYMAFDNGLGSGEGACLVFANTAREARNIAAGTVISWFDSEFIDVVVTKIKDSGYLDELSVSEKPHVIESPPICHRCELWGVGILTDNYCEDCQEQIDDDLERERLQKEKLLEHKK